MVGKPATDRKEVEFTRPYQVVQGETSGNVYILDANMNRLAKVYAELPFAEKLASMLNG